MPFEDFSVKNEEDDDDVDTVKPAQVPVVYHVPYEMMQPFLLPPVTTFKYPFPLNAGPVGFGPAL